MDNAGGMRRRSELADFLRARREAVSPSEVGLAVSGRRRTPGLRREELATLAGVSVDYIVRLEQGRDLRPSSSVLGAIAKALGLGNEERHHLAQLALLEKGTELCPNASPLGGDVPATVQKVLDALGLTPGLVLGPANHVLAWNHTWARLVEDMGVLDENEPNLPRYVFLHPKAPATFPDWEKVADEQVSRLRAADVTWRDDAAFEALISSLTQVRSFVDRWSRHIVAEAGRGPLRVHHPAAGELRFAYEQLLLAEGGERRLVTWVPADDASAASVAVVVAGSVPVSPAKLRLVGNK